MNENTRFLIYVVIIGLIGLSLFITAIYFDRKNRKTKIIIKAKLRNIANKKGKTRKEGKKRI